ncbi:odorant receptor 4-like [Aphomia sociella]
MTKAVFEKSLKLTKLSLLLSGIQINQRKYSTFVEKLVHYLFYFNLSCVYSDVVAEFFWLFEGIRIGKSFLELSLTAPCITVSFLGTAKTIFLFHYKDLILNVLAKLRIKHPEVDDEEEITDTETDEIEAEIVKDTVKYLNIVVLLLYYVCTPVVVAFSLMPAVEMGYNYYKTGQTKYLYPYLVIYFFDHYTFQMWPFVYLHQVWSTVVVAVNVFGADTLLYALCAYIQMHFNILCHRFENMVMATNEETRARMRKLIVTHQELIEMVNEIEILYSKSTLFNIVTSSVLICLSGFNITTLTDVSVGIMFGTFLFMSLSQISLLCFFGDLLVKSSTALTVAVYNSTWYETDHYTRKCVLLILMRTQKPCKLTAAKFADLNLTAFTTILSRSWSYFALLRTMYKQ